MTGAAVSLASCAQPRVPVISAPVPQVASVAVVAAPAAAPLARASCKSPPSALVPLEPQQSLVWNATGTTIAVGASLIEASSGQVRATGFMAPKIGVWGSVSAIPGTPYFFLPGALSVVVDAEGRVVGDCSAPGLGTGGVSPDGRFVVLNSQAVCDVKQQRLVRAAAEPRAERYLGFWAGGEWLYFGGDDRGPYGREVTSGRVVELNALPKNVAVASISPKGTLNALIDFDEHLSLWSAKGRKLMEMLLPTDHSANELRFTPSEHALFASVQAGSVVVDLVSRRVEHLKGRWLLAKAADAALAVGRQTVMLWRWRRPLVSLGEFSTDYNGLAISDGGEQAAIGDGSTLTVRDLSGSFSTRTLQFDGRIARLAYRPGSLELAVLTTQGLEMVSGNEHHLLIAASVAPQPLTWAVSPDAKRLAFVYWGSDGSGARAFVAALDGGGDTRLLDLRDRWNENMSALEWRSSTALSVVREARGGGPLFTTFTYDVTNGRELHSTDGLWSPDETLAAKPEFDAISLLSRDGVGSRRIRLKHATNANGSSDGIGNVFWGRDNNRLLLMERFSVPRSIEIQLREINLASDSETWSELEGGEPRVVATRSGWVLSNFDFVRRIERGMQVFAGPGVAAYAPDTDVLVVAREREARSVDTAGAGKTWSASWEKPPSAAAVDAPGRLLAVGHGHGVTVLDLSTGRELSTLALEGTSEPLNIAHGVVVVTNLDAHQRRSFWLLQAATGRAARIGFVQMGLAPMMSYVVGTDGRFDADEKLWQVLGVAKDGPTPGCARPGLLREWWPARPAPSRLDQSQ